MLRTTKKQDVGKRSIALYKDEESKSENDDDDIDGLKEEIKTLSQKLREKENEVKKSEKYAELLADLFQKGIIDANGDFIEK